MLRRSKFAIFDGKVTKNHSNSVYLFVNFNYSGK